MAVAASMFAASTAVAQTTQKLTANKVNEYGLIYNLPMTAFDITLEIEGEVLKPGEFYNYARIYLNADPIMAQSQSWHLKSATIVPVGVADTSEQYLVQFKSGATPYMIIGEESIPLAVNTDEVAPPATVSLPKEQPMQPTVLERPEAAYAFSGEMLAGTSLAKRAELAAAKIFEIRDTRNEIIAGQSDNMPSDGSAMKIALDNLAQQEAALTAMFVGTRQSCTRVATFRYIPAMEDETIVIARISALDGFVVPTDLSGDPVYVTFAITEKGELPVNEKGEVKRFPKGGLAYRIPGKAGLTVRYDGADIASDEFAVAQCGVVFGLDPGLFTDKKAPAYLIFDPVTGGVRELGSVE